MFFASTYCVYLSNNNFQRSRDLKGIPLYIKQCTGKRVPILRI